MTHIIEILRKNTMITSIIETDVSTENIKLAS